MEMNQIYSDFKAQRCCVQNPKIGVCRKRISNIKWKKKCPDDQHAETLDSKNHDATVQNAQ